MLHDYAILNSTEANSKPHFSTTAGKTLYVKVKSLGTMNSGTSICSVDKPWSHSEVMFLPSRLLLDQKVSHVLHIVEEQLLGDHTLAE